MIGKILGAVVGRKLASGDNKGRGTVVGMVAPAVARRVTPGFALVLAGGWAAKKLWDRRRARAAA